MFETSRGKATRLAALALALGLAAGGAEAASFTLNFDDQGLVGSNGGVFPVTPDSPLEVVLAPGLTVTFAGGGLLTNTFGVSVNTTTVYGSSQLPGYVNPLTVSFSTPVSALTFDLISGGVSLGAGGIVDGVFQADFGGDSDSEPSLPFDTSVNLFLDGTGTLLTVELLNPPVSEGAFSYFIDNLGFTADLETSAVPAPAPLALLGLGLIGLAAGRRR